MIMTTIAQIIHGSRTIVPIIHGSQQTHTYLLIFIIFDADGVDT